MRRLRSSRVSPRASGSRPCSYSRASALSMTVSSAGSRKGSEMNRSTISCSTTIWLGWHSTMGFGSSPAGSRLSSASSQPWVHFLVRGVQVAKVRPMAVDVQTNMRDHEPAVVSVAGRALDVHPHDSANELDIGTKGPERIEDGRNAQWWMVESFAEHADLDDHIEGVVAKFAQDCVAFFGRHL